MLSKQILIQARNFLFIFVVSIIGLAQFQVTNVFAADPVENPQSGSTGLQGTISAPPPTTGATISIPRDGQSFSENPVNVSGICPDGLLVKLFKNNVFAGSAQCTGGSFSMPIDLFNDQNQLVARVYDALDQPGPDSNTVTVTYTTTNPSQLDRVNLTSNYAKRGANPGQLLVWPIIISGGSGPYAVNIDWGDGKEPDLQSVEFPGQFDIQHVYDNPGVYNILIKATDKNGNAAYLQLIGVGNGPLTQATGTGSGAGSDIESITTRTRILWEPAAIVAPFVFLTFWLGKKHELKTLKQKIEQGKRPF